MFFLSFSLNVITHVFMSLHFSICKLELILLWHLKGLFWEETHKDKGEFSYWSTDYHLNYVFLLITCDGMQKLAVYFLSVKAMPSSNQLSAVRITLAEMLPASTCSQWEVRGPSPTRKYQQTLLQVSWCQVRPSCKSVKSQQDNNCAQRKPSKTSKRNLLRDERENYYGNQLC